MLLSAEDGNADTIKPRLVAMSADCQNIVALDNAKAINPLPAIEKQKREAATGTCDINPESNPTLKSQLNTHETVRNDAKQYEKGPYSNEIVKCCKPLQTTNLCRSRQGKTMR